MSEIYRILMIMGILQLVNNWYLNYLIDYSIIPIIYLLKIKLNWSNFYKRICIIIEMLLRSSKKISSHVYNYKN